MNVICARVSVQIILYPLRSIRVTKSSLLRLFFMDSPMWYINWNFQLSPFCAARHSRADSLEPPPS